MTGMNCDVDGTVVKEPKAGTTRNGKPYVNVTISYEEYTGETKICLVNAYGPAAISAAQRLQVGQKVHVEGAGFPNNWEKDGVQKSGISINANRIEPIPPQQAD